MLIVWELFAGAVIVAAVATIRQRMAPVPVALWILSGIILLSGLNPLDLYPVSERAAVIVIAGIASLGLPTVFRMTSEAQSQPMADDTPRAHGRFVIVSTLVLIIVLIGFQTFVSNIAVATGRDFGQLSLIQIRAAQNGAARGGGLFALFAAAGPLLACLGIYGANRFSRWWLALIVIAVGISLQSPSRLNSIGLVVTLVTFWLYVAYAHRIKPSRKSRRIRRILLPVAGAVGALVLFNAVGAGLGKNQFTQSVFPAYEWPTWTLSPIIYFSGGLSALSAALTSSIDPYQQGSSYYVLLRLAEVFDDHVIAPDTIGEWVGIPIPFNLYTGFGQIYFDLGILGVIFFCGALGWLSVSSHRRAMERSLPAAWVSAVALNVLLSLPLGFIALNLDVVFRLFLGAWAFWFIDVAHRATRPRSGTHSALRGLTRPPPLESIRSPGSAPSLRPIGRQVPPAWPLERPE